MSEKAIERPRKSTKTYASRVFQESSVGIVASLAHTASGRRRFYKALAFILCLAGFLYQSGQFLAVVFQYPTSVGIDIFRPDMLHVPAFTFCDNNGLNRKIFCEKFPNRCERPSETFCKKYSSYCGENKTLVPKREHYGFQSSKTLEEMIEFNAKMEDFVKVTESVISENVTGPYLRLREDSNSNLMCYSLYERVNNALLPPQAKKNKIVREPVTTFQFRVVEEEIFLPGSKPGVLLAVHSPFQAVNPFEIGIFMKPGRSYMIFVSIEEELMLQKPYDTDCVNYTQIWEDSGRTGPRLQETCRQNCLAEISIKCFDCLVPGLTVAMNKRYCTDDEDDSDETCPDDYLEQIEQCSLKCRDDCRQIKFTYDVQERFNAHFTDTGEEIEDQENIIKVEIYLEGDEIVVLKHSPKYMIVEVFSSIGGFIGCWLGINLLDITDIVEGLFRITRYSLKKR